jgi:plastocyanin
MIQMIERLRWTSSLAVLGALALVACGDDGDAVLASGGSAGSSAGGSSASGGNQAGGSSAGGSSGSSAGGSSGQGGSSGAAGSTGGAGGSGEDASGTGGTAGSGAGAGSGGGDGGSDAPAPLAEVVDCSSATADATVTIQGSVAMTFNPGSVAVNVGDVVKWVNDTQTNHTVTSGLAGNGNQWAELAIAPKAQNGQGCIKFLAAGSYQYHCSVHATMLGTVNVQ